MDKTRAWVMIGPGKIELQEFDIPKIQEDAALLKIEACAVCGSDKHIYEGRLSSAAFPMIPGHEFIGTIAKIGKSANEKMAVIGNGPLKEGDRVAIVPSSLPCGHCWYCLHMPNRPSFCTGRTVYGFTSVKNPPHLWGGFADYLYLHSRSWVFKLPDGISMERAVQTEPMSCGLRAVERAMNPGEPFMGQGYGVGSRVLVLGAGPIGLMVIIALRASGADLVIVQDVISSRLSMAKQMAADVIIDGKLPFEQRLKKIQEMTDGVGPDVVIEAAGAPVAFKEALMFVRRGGKVVEVGHFTDPGPIDLHPWTVCFKDVDIHGSFGFAPIIYKDALSLLSRTPLKVEEIVTHKMNFEELPNALGLVGKDGVGKIVIQP
jgi:L-iditol 2-dehydrogenase